MRSEGCGSLQTALTSSLGGDGGGGAWMGAARGATNPQRGDVTRDSAPLPSRAESLRLRSRPGAPLPWLPSRSGIGSPGLPSRPGAAIPSALPSGRDPRAAPLRPTPGGFPTPSARRPHARNPDPRRRERSARPRPPMVPRGGGGRPMSAIPACRAAGQQPEQPRPHPLPPLRASSRPPSASEEPPPAPRPLPPPRAAARPAMPSRAR